MANGIDYQQKAVLNAKEFNQRLFGKSGDNEHSAEQILSRKVFDLASQFLYDTKMLRPDVLHSDSMTKQIASMASVNGEMELNRVSESAVRNLVRACEVPPKFEDQACQAVAVFMSKLQACAGNDELYRSQHFGRSREALDSPSLKNNMEVTFAPGLFDVVNATGIPSQEAFGADIDKVLPDIRASLAVTLLQFHRGILDRIMHRRTAASPYIKYVVPYAEVYDMLKSNDPDYRVRYEGEHIQPFIEMYGDPRVVSNQLTPIIPLMSNDTESVLYADGYVKFNVVANLFDLSRLPNQLGFTHYNFTDLVSENVVLNDVIVSLAKGGKKEFFRIDLAHVQASKLQMKPNTNDSGIRQCTVTYTVRLLNTTKTVAGSESEILADCTNTDFICLDLRLGTQINLKEGTTDGMGFATARAFNKNKVAVASAVANIVDGLEVTLEAYSLDVRYSEENLRKSNLAIRHHVRTFDFEISNGRNILVDYSFNEELPEFLMSLVTEAVSLGQDHRGLDIIITELMHVYDETNAENDSPNFRARRDKIGFQYVSSQMVRPVVYLNTIDLEQVDSIRSSDILGDIRQYVEWELLNLVSLIYQNSYYKHQLKPGEKPVFKCLTSSVILENILSIPHIHNHLSNDESVDGSTVEYRRVLPNGTILDCVTTTFDYMRDKIVMIPYRESEPECVLNWGHNWDFGTFVAHYNPQLDNGVNKRMFANARTMPIPTNPMGMYLDVRGLSKFIDMFQLTNHVGTTTVPQPYDILKAEVNGEVTGG